MVDDTGARSSWSCGTFLSREENIKNRKNNIRCMTFYTVFSALFFSICQWNLFDAYLLLLARDRGSKYTNAWVGLAESVSGISSLILAIPVGIMVDKYDRVRICRIAAVVGIVATVITAYSFARDSVMGILINLILWGIFGELASSASEALFADSLPQGKRSGAMTQNSIITTLCLSIGPFSLYILFKITSNTWTSKQIHIPLVLGCTLGIPACIYLWHFKKVLSDDVIASFPYLLRGDKPGKNDSPTNTEYPPNTFENPCQSFQNCENHENEVFTKYERNSKKCQKTDQNSESYSSENPYIDDKITHMRLSSNSQDWSLQTRDWLSNTDHVKSIKWNFSPKIDYFSKNWDISTLNTFTSMPSICDGCIPIPLGKNEIVYNDEKNITPQKSENCQKCQKYETTQIAIENMATTSTGMTPTPDGCSSIYFNKNYKKNNNYKFNNNNMNNNFNNDNNICYNFNNNCFDNNSFNNNNSFINSSYNTNDTNNDYFNNIDDNNYNNNNNNNNNDNDNDTNDNINKYNSEGVENLYENNDSYPPMKGNNKTEDLSSEGVHKSSDWSVDTDYQSLPTEKEFENIENKYIENKNYEKTNIENKYINENRDHTASFNFLNPYVPYIVTLSDFIRKIGAGMTVKFFALFFIKDYLMSPASMSLLFTVYPLCISIFMASCQRLSMVIGRTQAVALYQILSIISLYIMVYVDNLYILIIVFITRGSFANASYPIDRSIIMDYVPSRNRGKWNALESITSITWSGSAFLGGILADSHDYRYSFKITGYIYLVSFLLYLPLLIMVPNENRKKE